MPGTMRLLSSAHVSPGPDLWALPEPDPPLCPSSLVQWRGCPAGLGLEVLDSVPRTSLTIQVSSRTPKRRLPRSFVTTSLARDVLWSTPYRGLRARLIRGDLLVASNNRCS